MSRPRCRAAVESAHIARSWRSSRTTSAEKLEKVVKPAAEPGDDQQAPLRRQTVVQRKERHRDADDIAAEQIGGQRAQRHDRSE